MSPVSSITQRLFQSTLARDKEKSDKVIRLPWKPLIVVYRIARRRRGGPEASRLDLREPPSLRYKTTPPVIEFDTDVTGKRIEGNTVILLLLISFRFTSEETS